MSTLLTILHIIVCLFLMLTVLLQSGKGGGMGAAFGGGNAATVFGGSGASSFLRKLTAGAATVFMSTSMVLAFLASHNAADALEKFGESQSKLAADKGPQVPQEYLYDVVDALDAVAKETGRTIPQVALNWLLQRPSVATVIIGARNEEQLRQNLGAVGWKLTPAQIAKLDAASTVPLAYPYWHQRLTFSERNPPAI